MPIIDTLVPDIYKLLDNPNTDWEFDVAKEAALGGRMIRHIRDEVSDPDRTDRDPFETYVTQYTSACHRRVWYNLNPADTEDVKERISGQNRFKFVYGDLIEEMVLYLAELAGHDVQYPQERFTLDLGNGKTVAGRIDAVIDGVLVDVKSMEGFTFDRMLKGTWEDKFGYVKQLGIYAYMMNCSGFRIDEAAILAVNKVNGRMLVYPVHINHSNDYTNAMSSVFAYHAFPEMHRDEPERQITSKFGLDMLAAGCAYCPYKFDCYKDLGGLTVYAYSDGPKFVVGKHKTPKVADITKAYMAEAGIS